MALPPHRTGEQDYRCCEPHGCGPGIPFEVTDRTDFYDGLRRFQGLREGPRVEVDFESRGGRHNAREIELED